MLTMQLVEEALSDFQTISHIENYESLLGIRFGNGGLEQYLYILRKNKCVIVRSGKSQIQVFNTSLESVSDAIMAYSEKIASWEKEITDAVLGSDLQQFIDVSVPIFGNPILIADEQSMTCAISKHPKGTVNQEWDYILEFGRMSWDKVDAIFGDAAFQEIMEHDWMQPIFYQPPGMPHRAVNCRIPIPTTESAFATLVIIEKDRVLTEGMLQLVKQLAIAIKSWAGIHRSSGIISRSGFLARMLEDENVSEEELLHHQRIMGYSGFSLRVLLIQQAGTNAESYLVSLFERRLSRCTCFESIGALYAICAVDVEWTVFLESLVQISRQYKLSIGISYPFMKFSGIKNALRQATIALHSAQSPCVIPINSAVILNNLTSQLKGSPDAFELCHPAVTLLQESDRDCNGVSLETLYIFLRNERNLVKTANALCIHRNTLVYRMERIRDLIAPTDLNNPDTRELILLSVRSMYEVDKEK